VAVYQRTATRYVALKVCAAHLKQHIGTVPLHIP